MVYKQHLLLFGHQGNINLTKKETKRFLFEICKIINLNALSKPLVETGTVKPGLTGVIVIEESHIAIHTFTNHPNEFWLDILSCKNFNEKKIINYINNRFNFKKINIER